MENITYLALTELLISIIIGVTLLYFTFSIINKFIRRKNGIKYNNISFAIFTSSIIFSVGYLLADIKAPILNTLRLLRENPDYTGNIYVDGFKYTHKFDKNMTKILPYIAECNATLCFNWPGQEEHLTSRYNEALGCDVIPLVWKDYDCNNQLVYSDWQRCYSFEDIQKKCLELSDNNVRLKHLNDIKNKYLKVTKPLEYYEDSFNQKLMEILND